MLKLLAVTAIALLTHTPSVFAGVPYADPQVPGAMLFRSYAELNNSASYGPIICDQGRSIVSEYVSGGEAVPLAIRLASAEACKSGARQFTVADFGMATFRLESLHGFQVFAPHLSTLKTAHEAASHHVRKIYFVTSVLEAWEAMAIAIPEIELLQESGYQVVFTSGFEKADLIKVLADDSTYGVVLDSHGQSPFPVLGFGGGYWVDSKGDLIAPSDIVKVSQNLRFMTALGCFGEYLASDYRKKLKLPADRYHFLSDSHSKNVIDHYFRKDEAHPYRPVAVRYGDFSPERDARSATALERNNFFKQVRVLLPN